MKKKTQLSRSSTKKSSQTDFMQGYFKLEASQMLKRNDLDRLDEEGLELDDELP